MSTQLQDQRPSHRDKRTLRLATLLGTMLLWVPAAQAKDSHNDGPAPQLAAHPATCVALHKGQICYQWIELRWQNLPPGQFCLFQDEEPTALLCWRDRATGSHRHRYASATTERYSLRPMGGQDSLPQLEYVISTAWVYRTGRRSSSGWRLF